MTVHPAETKYYDEGGVLITNARAVLGSMTYPLANVSSVGVGQTVPSGGPLLVTLLLAVSSVMCAVGSEDYRALGIIGTVAFGVITWALYQNSKPSYYVKLGSAGGEQRALEGRSQAEVEMI